VYTAQAQAISDIGVRGTLSAINAIIKALTRGRTGHFSTKNSTDAENYYCRYLFTVSN